MRYLTFGMGLIPIGLGIFLLCENVIALIRSRCVVGKICDIGHAAIYCPGATTYHIVVQLKEDGRDMELVTVNHFSLAPFFEKSRLSRLRRKHIGRQVHIYYNPDHKKHTMLREYMWKDFMWCAFLFLLGGLLTAAGIFDLH